LFRKVENLDEIIDADLVSHVFKEVLTHFKVYKKNPHKFDGEQKIQFF